VFQQFITAEYASLTRGGEPITTPVTPYVGAAGTLDISTGLTYPTKAERARRNPHVALLYSDPKGSGLQDAPMVLVQGRAAVRDADLQANTDRYMRESARKLPAASAGMPPFLLRTMGYYYTRIWVEILPTRVLWWPAGQLDTPPQVWEAPVETVYPESDPSPAGKAPGAWKDAPPDWKAGAERAVEALGLPVLSVTGADGWPYLMRARSVALTAEGFELAMPGGITWPATGPACLTFHYHPEQFTGQENMMFVGTARQDGSTVRVDISRRIGDWSAGGNNRMRGLWSFVTAGFRLRPRLREECMRRNQPVPKINLPG
jgi:hypothetical protein